MTSGCPRMAGWPRLQAAEGPSFLMGCSVHPRRKEGMPSGCPRTTRSIKDSIGLHTYLLNSYHAYVLGAMAIPDQGVRKEAR